MKQILAAAALAAFLAPASLFAAQPARQAIGSEQEGDLDRIVAGFYKQLLSGKVEEAISGAFATSPLWKGKDAELQTLKDQIEHGLSAFGPVVSYEIIENEPLGTLFVRRRYLVQHRNMITLWQWDFVRTEKGWAVGYFGFDGKVKEWPDRLSGRGRATPPPRIQDVAR